MSPDKRVISAIDELADALDQLQIDCVRRCPADRVRVLDANFERLMRSITTMSVQAANIIRLYDGCPPPHRADARGNVRPFRRRK